MYIKGGYNRIDNKPLQGRTSVAMDNQLALGARQDIDDDDDAAGASAAAAAAVAAVIIVPSLSFLIALLPSLSTLPILPFIPRPISKTHQKIHKSNSQSVISSLFVCMWAFISQIIKMFLGHSTITSCNGTAAVNNTIWKMASYSSIASPTSCRLKIDSNSKLFKRSADQTKKIRPQDICQIR